MWDRRAFLKSLLTLGLSNTLLNWVIQRESQFKSAYLALADPNSRKLALLVGVDQAGQNPALPGCLTDVELQRDLLLHRFGFNAADIVTLTQQQATREAIEDTFLSHLVAQAQTGDVVLFHYSGYGSQLQIPDSPDGSQIQLNQALLTEASPLNSTNQAIASPIFLETLYLLGQSLATDKFTFVLDTSYILPSDSYFSNFPVRSAPPLLNFSETEEFAFQETLRSRLKSSNRKTKRATAGTYLFAAKDQQIATELIADHFRAGFFTYLLTQYLWQTTSASKLTITVNQTRQRLSALMEEAQQPQIGNEAQSSLLTYYLLPETSSGAEGVITEILDDKVVKIRLYGLSYPTINYLSANSTLSLAEDPNIVLQIRSKTGLEATATLLNPAGSLAVGQLFQEQKRVINAPITLNIALNNQLQRIERVDATSALTNLNFVGSVHNIGEGIADCLLGKAPAGGYGLFSAGGILLANTEGTDTEAIKGAVERLTPYFQQQLAFKLYELTDNEDSSRLAVKVSLESLEKTPQLISQRQTQRRQATILDNPPVNGASDLPQVNQGNLLQFRIDNQSDRPLYVVMTGLTPSNQPLFSLGVSEGIVAGDSAIFAQSDFVINNNLASTQGIYRLKVICSQKPFLKLQKNLNTATATKNLASSATVLSLAQDLLSDLSSTPASDRYILEVEQWATLNFVYRVL